MGKLLLGDLTGPQGPQGVPGTLGPWDPTDAGLVAANGDPWLAQGTRIMTAGVVYLMKLRFRSSATVAKIGFGVAVAGSGASSGSYVGLYSSAGSLLSESSDIASSYFQTTGAKSPSLAVSQPVTAATWGWAAIIANMASVQPTLITGLQTPNSFTNLNQTVQTARFGSYGSALTQLPATLTLANIVFSNNSYWASAS